MHDLKKVKRLFFDTLKEVSEKSRGGDSFSGIGMLLYERDVFSEKYCTDLRPSFSCPKDVVIGRKKTIKTLLEMCDISNSLHDGFIFFNEKGEMTHVSQYFVPLPVEEITPNESYGTRYRTAQYGSFLEGVILTGVVNHDNKHFVFYKGQCIGLDEEIE